MRPILITAAVAAALGLSACGFGEEGISVPKDDPTREGAVLFATHCSGCHTLAAAGTQGTGNRSVRTQGPNLDQRTETYEDALFAIQNGGFSGAIMPQNIVVGEEAEAVARFVAKYAGTEAEESPRPSAEEESSPSSEGAEAPTTGEASEPGGHSEGDSSKASHSGSGEKTSP